MKDLAGVSKPAPPLFNNQPANTAADTKGQHHYEDE